MAVCMIITNYVLFEKSYDTFHKKGKDIVRVTYSRFIDGEFQFSKAQVFPTIGETLKQSIPDVEEFTRMFPISTYQEPILSIEDNNRRKRLSETSIYAVDSSFLSVFSLSLITGNIRTALSGENKFLLSKSTARKFFGDEEALGKSIHWEGMGDWQVTGVFEDLPENSHMKFDILSSWMNVYGERSAWNWDGFYTYLLLKPNTDLRKSEELIQRVLAEKLNERPDANRVKATFQLQPLTDIHLNSHLSGEMKPNGNSSLVLTLQLVAIIILTLAIINYFNLSLARTIKRAKEVGVRKIIGSTRGQLTGLFMAESFTFNIISLILGLLIFIVSRHSFNDLVGKSVAQMFWIHPTTSLLCIATILFVISLISAAYPARIILSNPIIALKGSRQTIPTKGFFRKSLLTIQFIVTIMMVTATIVIQKQVHFMQSQSLGFNIDQNLVIKTFAGSGAEMDSSFLNKMNLFKNKIKENTSVNNATITSNIPGRENDWIGRLIKPDGDQELITAARTRVDTDFVETYGLTIVAGNNFKNENPKQVLLNQSASSMLGYSKEEDAIGDKLMGDYEIVGIIEDYHEQSLQQSILPAIFTPGQGYMKYITVNVKPGNVSESLVNLNQQWKVVYPDTPFEYFFLDDFFNLQYQQEKQLTKVFAYFSGIGIFIACLGLFGFTYYVSHQRIKEIGIRKTLGASLFNLLKLLSSEFLLLVLVAGAVAIPLSHYLSTQWLSNYMVRIEPGLQLYLFPVFFISTLGFLSILFLLLKVIKINPSESLKYDS